MISVKKFGGRFLSMLLALVMMCAPFAAMPPAASADPVEYPLWVGGTRVTSANASDILSDGAVSYDAATNTLKLKGATIEGKSGSNESDSIGIYFTNSEGLTIEASGTNTVSGKDTAQYYAEFGIKSSEFAPLTIILKDGANLDVKGALNKVYSDNISSAASSQLGHLTVKGRGTLNFIGGACNMSSGLGCRSLTVEDDVALISRSNAAGLEGAPGIYGFGARIYSGSIILKGNADVKFYGRADGAIFVNDGLSVEAYDWTGSMTASTSSKVIQKASSSPQKFQFNINKIKVTGYTDENSTEGGTELTQGICDFGEVASSYKKLTFAPKAPVTVTFEMNGHGEQVPAQPLVAGAHAVMPPNPVASGWTFGGWYADSTFSQTFDFTAPINQNTKVYAKWTKAASGGGSSGSGVTKYYTLSFDTGGGSAISSVTKASGTTINLADYVPVKDGYDFAGWYGDKAMTEKVTSLELIKSMTLYAKWEEKSKAAENPLPFIDVKMTDWFYGDINYVYDKGIMKSVSETSFAPKTPTTSAMLVTMLYRLEKEPEVSGKSTFADVADGMWYSKAIAWAQMNKIVEGHSATVFGPKNNISREQLAAILYRYAQYKGYDVSKSADLSGFTDSGSIKSYAAMPMKWAVAEGLIQGMGNDMLSPSSGATRAQIAAIVHRFCEKVK